MINTTDNTAQDIKWRHWSELPTTETWCLIAYKWKYSKDQTRINYMVDRTIEGKAQWWGTDPERILEDFKYQLREKLGTAYYTNRKAQPMPPNPITNPQTHA